MASMGAILVAWCSPGLAASFYSVRDLGAPAGAIGTEGNGIGPTGAVVGSSWSSPGVQRAFVWNDGVWTALPPLPGGTTNVATAANVSGYVTGYTAPIAGRAFFWNGVSMRALGTLPTSAGTAYSYGLGINDLGHVVGYSSSSAGMRGFYWNGFTLRALGVMPGFDRSQANDVNNAGEVAGVVSSSSSALRRAVVWRGTTLISLGVLIGGTRSDAKAINAAGHVVGMGDSSLGERAFLWNRTFLVNLGTLPGGSASAAVDINSGDQIVGSARVGSSTRAFVWDAGTMYDLASRITPADPLRGQVQLRFAMGINDAGQIVVNGIMGSLPRTFLLTPVP